MPAFPRFTVRRLMIAVAVAAVLLAAGSWVVAIGRRSRHYGSIARRFSAAEGQARDQAFYLATLIGEQERRLARLRGEDPADPSAIDRVEEILRDARAERDHCRRILIPHRARLAEKYAEAAARPWAAVPPDPPEPPGP